MSNTLLNKFRYAAVFNNNGHEGGFQSKAVFSNTIQKEWPDNGFVFLNYDLKNRIENLTSKNFSSLKFPEQLYFKTEHEEIFDDQYLSSDNINSNINLKCTQTKEQYIQNVNSLKHHIQQGDIYEINYCIKFEAKDCSIDPLSVYSKLNSISKAPYSALVKMDDKFIICSSPELFLSKRGNKLFTKPIKGTARRSSNSSEDNTIKNELQNSLKERTENVMIVDVARNDLSRIAKKGSVKVEKLYDIESYEQVHQMVSTASCELKDNISLKDILHATFPMASMTGAPKIRAMQLIDEYEHYNRGPFSGSIGYIHENGDFDLNVLIRSIFYNASEKYLSFSVGSAITHLCDPEKEYEECLLKAQAMLKALQ